MRLLDAFGKIDQAAEKSAARRDNNAREIH